MSFANDLAMVIATRLQTLNTASGFETDIGSKVFRGRRRLDPEQLPCAVIIEREETPSQQSSAGMLRTERRYTLEGHTTCDPDNPNDAGHKIIADLKRAIFKDAIHIDGKISVSGAKAFRVDYHGSQIAPREDGFNTVAASIDVTIQYAEELSNP